MAPSITMPAAPRLCAIVSMISPRSALLVSPPPSTTRTSPGRIKSRASWMTRLSPGQVRTVNAVPTRTPALWKGRMPTAPGRRLRLSLMTAVAALLKPSITVGLACAAQGYFLHAVIAHPCFYGGPPEFPGSSSDEQVDRAGQAKHLEQG